jgi:HEPN domain-containing protein
MEAKLLLRHGVYHISHGKPSRLDRRFGVHHAHHAVELTLRKKASELGASTAEIYDFPRLIKYLNGKGIAIGYQRELEELNKTRELIQHYGQVPDEKDAYRLVRAAANCMKEFCSTAFGIDYDKLSPTDLISNQEIRKTLAEAQEAYDKGKFEDAAIAAHLAIQQGKWIVKEKAMSQRYRHHLSLDTERLMRDVAQTIDDIDERLEDVLDIALSAPFAYSFQQLRDITCAVFHRTTGGIVTQVMKEFRDHEPTAEDADFALELASEYLLWADQAYGLVIDSKN